MNYPLLFEVIKNLEEFEKEKNSGTLEDFRCWLNSKAYQNDNPTELLKEHNSNEHRLENEICKQVIMLSRFTKQIIRKGLSDIPQLANEEFTYLFRLMDYDSLTKMQLVEKNGHEKQTGIEVIKRLLKNGLIEEYQDEHDARTRRVKVTALGKRVFKDSIPKVTTVSRVLCGKISYSEKEILLSTLKKLNDFHYTIYQEFRNSDMQEISELL